MTKLFTKQDIVEIMARIGDWNSILLESEEFNKGHLLVDIFKQLNKTKIKDTEITPEKNNIFRAFNLTPFSKIRVVILGQDPYPGSPNGNRDANGLCFSSYNNIAPPSLKNIYKRLLKDKYLSKQPKSHDLGNWARQGILMLNTFLTTKIGCKREHSKIWSKFTDAVISYISTYSENKIIFLLWGNDAQNKSNLINKEKHIILTSVHPSPLNGTQFIEDCNHFIKVNEILTTNNQQPINWNHEYTYKVFTDGSWKPITGRGGYGIKFTSPWNKELYGELEQTLDEDDEVIPINHVRAEGIAICVALHTIIKNKMPGNIKLITDSELYVNICTNWIYKWEQENKIDEHKNADVNRRLLKLLKMANEMGTLDIIHIRSHQAKPKPGGTYEKYSVTNVFSYEECLEYWQGNKDADEIAKYYESDSNSDSESDSESE